MRRKIIMKKSRKLCRLCLIEGGILLNIFGPGKSYVGEINTCLSLEVDQDDSFSKEICIKCAGQLEECSPYVNQVSKFHRELKSRKKDSLLGSVCYYCRSNQNFLFSIPQASSKQTEACFNFQAPHRAKICHRCQFYLDTLYELKHKSLMSLKQFATNNVSKQEGGEPKEASVEEIVHNLKRKFSPRSSMADSRKRKSDDTELRIHVMDIQAYMGNNFFSKGSVSAIKFLREMPSGPGRKRVRWASAVNSHEKSSEVIHENGCASVNNESYRSKKPGPVSSKKRGSPLKVSSSAKVNKKANEIKVSLKLTKSIRTLTGRKASASSLKEDCDNNLFSDESGESNSETLILPVPKKGMGHCTDVKSRGSKVKGVSSSVRNNASQKSSQKSQHHDAGASDKHNRHTRRSTSSTRLVQKLHHQHPSLHKQKKKLKRTFKAAKVGKSGSRLKRSSQRVDCRSSLTGTRAHNSNSTSKSQYVLGQDYKKGYQQPEYLTAIDKLLVKTPKAEYKPFVCSVCHEGYVSTVKGMLHQLVAHDARSQVVLQLTRCDGNILLYAKERESSSKETFVGTKVVNKLELSEDDENVLKNENQGGSDPDQANSKSPVLEKFELSTDNESADNKKAEAQDMKFDQPELSLTTKEEKNREDVSELDSKETESTVIADLEVHDSNRNEMKEGDLNGSYCVPGSSSHEDKKTTENSDNFQLQQEVNSKSPGIENGLSDAVESDSSRTTKDTKDSSEDARGQQQESCKSPSKDEKSQSPVNGDELSNMDETVSTSNDSQVEALKDVKCTSEEDNSVQEENCHGQSHENKSSAECSPLGDSHQEDSHQKDSNQKDSNQEDSDQEDSHQKESNQEDSNQKDSNQEDSDQEDSHQKESNQKDSNQKDSNQEDSHQKESHREDSYQEDSHEKDSSQEDSHQKESNQEDSHHEDSHQEDSHQKESNQEDSHHEDSNQEDSHQKESNQEDSHQKESHLEDSHQKDSNEEDSNQEDSHQKESHQKDSNEEDFNQEEISFSPNSNKINDDGGKEALHQARKDAEDISEEKEADQTASAADDQLIKSFDEAVTSDYYEATRDEDELSTNEACPSPGSPVNNAPSGNAEDNSANGILVDDSKEGMESGNLDGLEVRSETGDSSPENG